jgi:hypothetical protein
MKHLYHKAIFFYIFLICNGYVWSQTTGFSGTGNNIDVVYHRINWRINPDSAIKAIGGTVTTYFVVKQAAVNAITFDLNGVLTATAKYHGSSIAVTRPSANVIRLALPVSLAINTLDSVTISYNGTPPAVSGQAEGYQKKTSAGNNYIYTLAESFEDRDWWPCKADMQDKIDSMRFIISVPNGFRAATNGRLIDSSLSGVNRIYTWKTNYPIASYLVAVGVAKYLIYDRGTVNINGTNVPVWYFIFPGKTAGTYTSILNALDFSKQELTAFSTKYGDYGFKDDKHGYYEFGWNGGMEHQSFSAMSQGSMTSWSTIAHELMHQWFGDKVTFATWNHLWLAEGFARYGEALAAELVPALGQSASLTRSGFKSTANNATYRGYGCYIPDAQIVSSDVMWSSAYGTTVYERGAMVVSMLRTLLGDTKYFQAASNYMNDPALAYKSAVTSDLQNHMQNVVGGYDLTPFFNSFVYGNGYPTYSIDWAQSATNRITIRVASQTKSTGSTVSYYYTPIALRVQGSVAAQDTVIVVYDQNGKLSQGGNGITAPVTGNIISFNLNFNPVTVTFDPFFQTLANGSVNQVITLPVKISDFTILENGNSNKLKLSLYNDNNELQKIVLQKSNDGRGFSDAGIMLKESADGTLLHFVFTDNSPNSEITYYRAKLTTMSGEKFSKILKADNRGTGSGNVSPNPADKEARIKWKGGLVNKQYEVSVKSTEGQLVLTANTTDNFINLQTEKLPAGMYLVQVKQMGAVILESKMVVSR